MSCETCGTVKGIEDIQYSKTKKDAKDYAVQHQKDMAVYWEGGEWKFAEVEYSIKSSFAIREIVSQYN